jgi:hypothetical protein
LPEVCQNFHFWAVQGAACLEAMAAVIAAGAGRAVGKDAAIVKLIFMIYLMC